jgi:flagellar biosynthesis protein FlhG
MSSSSAEPREDQATRLRALMERLAEPERREARPTAPAPMKPATLGGRLGAEGWGRPASRSVVDQGDVTATRTRSRVIAIASGKGGVGKTNLSVSLSTVLARRGKRVTLLDADFGLANADVLAGVTPRGRIDEVISGRRPIRDILVETPGGFRLAAGASGVAKLVDAGEQTARAVVARLERLERDADLVVIDCAAGIGRPVLAMLLAADMPVVVATPEPTSITDAYGLIKATRLEAERAARVLTPQLWVNQAKDEREAQAVYEKIGAVSQRFLGAPVGLIGWTPSDPAVRDAVRKRTAVALAAPGKPAARSIDRTAGEILRRLEWREERDAGEAPGFFRRFASALIGQKV